MKTEIKKHMKTEIKKHEPIIWTKECELEVFFMIATGLELNYIIYVQDSEGNNKSIWATSKEDLIRCFSTFSKKCCFGRIEILETAMQSGFADLVDNNLNKKNLC